MYALIKSKVEAWNNLITDPNAAWVYAGVVGLQGFILLRLGSWIASYMSQAELSQLFELFQDITERLTVQGVDYCEAAREAFDHLNPLSVPSAVWEKVPDAHRPAFRLYWSLTGGLQGYDRFDPDLSVPVGCCLPDTFKLLPVVRNFSCGSNSYDLDVIGESDPDGVAFQVIVNRAGIPHVVRDSVANLWVRNVQRPGAFGLWYYYSDVVTNDGCAYLRSIDGDMTNMTWYLILPSGSPYIVWRNRVSGEGSILEFWRSQPSGWNGTNAI
jgi:hypothetical protein